MMTRRLVPAFLLTLSLGLGLALLPGLSLPASAPARDVEPAAPQAARPAVYLGGGLSDDNLVVLTATVAAGDPDAVVLLDSRRSGASARGFLSAFRPGRVVPVGSFGESAPALARRLGVRAEPVREWKQGRPLALWDLLFPEAAQVVVCPARPRGLFLQAACLAGAARAPLFVTRGSPGEAAELRRLLARWHTREVLAAGEAADLCRDLPDVRLVSLADQEAVAQAYLRRLLEGGPVRTLVVANPADTGGELGGMSTLAPWVALQHHAALLLTNAQGANVADLVRSAEPADADSLILVAGLKAIPMEHRPNPAPGKDPQIDMEPLTPEGTTEPFSFATGRLFHPDRATVALILARQRLLDGPDAPPRQAGGPRTLVASNPDGDLSFLEVISRNTAREMRNRGYRTTALFGDEVHKDELRRLVPEQDIFLWEGHYKTLTDDFGLPKWDEPLRPSLVFLQSCLALNEELAEPILDRGAVSVVGSSSRIYSATGGTFTLAFFDGLLYENQSQGGAMRQAKNFLLAYARLKEKRLGAEAKLTGANLRSAWAFTLWGDPTLKLPRSTPPADALIPVRHRIRGRTIVLTQPDTPYDPVMVGEYRSQTFPNARLAGLVSKDPEENRKRTVPFLFAEVALPDVPAGKTPHLRSRIAENRWVFTWDGRRRVGYLLATPRPRDGGELHFTVEWNE